MRQVMVIRYRAVEGTGSAMREVKKEAEALGYQVLLIPVPEKAFFTPMVEVHDLPTAPMTDEQLVNDLVGRASPVMLQFINRRSAEEITKLMGLPVKTGEERVNVGQYFGEGMKKALGGLGPKQKKTGLGGRMAPKRKR